LTDTWPRRPLPEDRLRGGPCLDDRTAVLTEGADNEHRPPASDTGPTRAGTSRSAAARGPEDAAAEPLPEEVVV